MDHFNQDAHHPLKKLRDILNMMQKPNIGSSQQNVETNPYFRKFIAEQKYYAPFLYNQENAFTIRNALHIAVSRYLKHCNQALEMQVDDAQINEMTSHLSSLTRAYRLIKESAFEHLKDFKKQGIVLAPLISLSHEMIEFIAKEGVLSFEEGAIDQAYQLLFLAVCLQPEHPVYALTLGRIEQKRGSYQNAIAAYNLIIVKNPHHPQAYYYKGQCYLRLKKENLAKFSMRRVMSLSQNLDLFESLYKDAEIFLKYQLDQAA